VVSLVLARPLGALLSVAPLAAVLSVNLAASLAAVLLRYRSTHWFARAGVDPGAQAAAAQRSDATLDRWPLARVIAARSPGAPLISWLLAFANAVIGGYFVQWVASGWSDKAPLVSALALAAGAGAGAVIGPHLGRGAASRFGYAGAMRLGLRLAACLAGVTGALVFLLAQPGALATGLAFAYVFLGALLGMGLTVVQVSARQVMYKGLNYSQMLGWSHSLSALGVLLGSWIGYLAAGAERPWLVLCWASLCHWFGAALLRQRNAREGFD
jgi:hypothetical protein